MTSSPRHPLRPGHPHLSELVSKAASTASIDTTYHDSCSNHDHAPMPSEPPSAPCSVPMTVTTASLRSTSIPTTAFLASTPSTNSPVIGPTDASSLVDTSITEPSQIWQASSSGSGDIRTTIAFTETSSSTTPLPLDTTAASAREHVNHTSTSPPSSAHRHHVAHLSSNQADAATHALPAAVAGIQALDHSPGMTRSNIDSTSSAPHLARPTLYHRPSSSALRSLSRSSSVRSALGKSVGSPSCSSTSPSPILSAMGDITPLPSPLLLTDSPGPWRMLACSPSARDLGSLSSPHLSTTGGSLPPLINPKRRMSSSLQHSQTLSATSHAQSHLKDSDKKASSIESLDQDASLPPPDRHTRNRSLSEFIPDPLAIPRRQSTVTSGKHPSMNPGRPMMRREAHLAKSRGLISTTHVAAPPTPPSSETSKTSQEAIDSKEEAVADNAEYFEAYTRNDNKRRRWKAVRSLGQGTFSRVVLCTSQIGMLSNGISMDEGAPLTRDVDRTYDYKSLVAVKVCEHGPRGGANKDRIEMSLKRELDIMKSIRHPSLVHLKAWNVEPTRAILVLGYCPGGDLFDIATTYRKTLVPSLLRRIFAEIVGAVRYLHSMMIVHRDIKLENVLVNLPPWELDNPGMDWSSYPYSVVTLTDLGLSRRIAPGEKLETRCGSDDYAAPEVIMGQPYDGMATDAWSVGVLLYALLEERLPFDPLPGASDAHRMRSRTSHRIARVEWQWFSFAGEESNHIGSAAKFQQRGLDGAMEITEGLLKRARSRWTLERVADTKWVQKAILIEGGLRFPDEQETKVAC